MNLIKRISLTRNFRGFPEAAIVEVYERWVKGCQAFIVHHVGREECSLDDKMRDGTWFLNPDDLCTYMTLMRHSFMTDLDVDVSELAIYTEESMVKALDAPESDGGQYRIIIRETDADLIGRRVRQGYYTMAVTAEYGVRINTFRAESIQEPYLTSLDGGKIPPTVYKSVIKAGVVAMGLAAVTYKTPWLNTLQALFAKPVIVIQQLENNHWSDVLTYPVISVNHCLEFNETLTETKLVYMG